MRFLHVFRSPVGGLFRHVRDLAKGQHALGHEVGLFCDSTTGGPLAEKTLAACASFCTAGITTEAISRLPSPSDLSAIRKAGAMAKQGRFDILHGHGAKGGLIARVVGWQQGIPSLYTPHGGSLHYRWQSPTGAAFLATEKLLARMGSGFVFVCDFERNAFAGKIGLAGRPSVVAHNGLWPEEFEPARANPDATDLLFVGEVRHLKGIDILLNALTTLPGVSLTIVGDGPELADFTALSQSLGLADRVRFAGRLPIHEAMKLGRVMVVPSRNESFPYVVLEAAAAALPLIATRVGGIPEVLPADRLCAPDAGEIAGLIRSTLADPALAARKAAALADAMRSSTSVAAMTQTITSFYTAFQR